MDIQRETIWLRLSVPVTLTGMSRRSTDKVVTKGFPVMFIFNPKTLNSTGIIINP